MASGLNDQRPQFSKLLQDTNIGVILVEHRDKATRFGFNYIALLLEAQKRRLEVINESDTQDELVDDFVALITSWPPASTDGDNRDAGRADSSLCGDDLRRS